MKSVRGTVTVLLQVWGLVIHLTGARCRSWFCLFTVTGHTCLTLLLAALLATDPSPNGKLHKDDRIQSLKLPLISPGHNLPSVHGPDADGDPHRCHCTSLRSCQRHLLHAAASKTAQNPGALPRQHGSVKAPFAAGRTGLA